MRSEVAKRESEKLTHAAVHYVDPSPDEKQCWRCEHYIGARETHDGDPACEGVQRPIDSQAYCERFEDILK